MEGDRERWNAKWRERAADLETESSLLSRYAHLLPRQGKVLDVAGGAGRNAIWLARRGLDVTLVDVSDVALDKAEERAKTAGLAQRIKLLRMDLELDLENELPFPPLYDLVLVMNYLDRARRTAFARCLLGGGILVACHPKTGRFAVEVEELELWVRELGFELLATSSEDGENGVIARRRAVQPFGKREPDEPPPSGGPYR